MNDNGSFEDNSLPIFDIMSLDSNGDIPFDYSCSHDSIEQDTSYSSSALGSTDIKTKDVKMDFTKTVPLLQNLKFFEDNSLEMKYLHKLDSLLRLRGYCIAPIRKKSSAKITALLKKEYQTDVPKIQKHLKDNKEVPKRRRQESNERSCNPKYRPESKVRLTLPSQTRKPSHLLSEYGLLGRHYRACDPNSNDRIKAQLAIIRRKEEEKEQAIERQKDNFSKKGVFGELSGKVMPED